MSDIYHAQPQHTTTARTKHMVRMECNDKRGCYSPLSSQSMVSRHNVTLADTVSQ